MARVHLPVDSAKLLQASFLDESLKIMTEDSTRRFAKISQCIVETNKIDAATLTEETAGAEEGYAEENHLDCASSQ